MNKKQFNLSEKIERGCNHYEFEECVFTRDIKEFIKKLKIKTTLLKYKMGHTDDNFVSKSDVLHLIDKLAGDKLI